MFRGSSLFKKDGYITVEWTCLLPIRFSNRPHLYRHRACFSACRVFRYEEWNNDMEKIVFPYPITRIESQQFESRLKSLICLNYYIRLDTSTGVLYGFLFHLELRFSFLASDWAFYSVQQFVFTPGFCLKFGLSIFLQP